MARRTRTTLALAAGTAALAVLATGCGGSPSSGAGSAAATGKPVRITYWSWTKNSQQVVDEFNRTHKDVRVDFSQITNGTPGYSKIFAAIKAGNGPDVFNCEYTELPQFAAQGDIQDISRYLTPALRSDFAPGTLGLTTLGGRSWAVPVDIEPLLYFYRKDLFAKYHLAVPTTWAQFRSTALKLRRADPRAVLGNLDTDDYTVAALAEQAGAHWFGTSGSTWKVDFHDPATRKVEQYWQGMLKDGLATHYVTTDPALAAEQSDGRQLGVVGPPFDGAAIRSTAPGLAGKWAAAPLPTWDGRAASGVLGGSTTAVTKDSRNTAAAAEFATWLATDPDAIRTRYTGGTSSSLPADPRMADIAAGAFDASYFGGQRIYSVFKSAAASLPSGWQWGPTMTSTVQTLADGLSRADSPGGLSAAVNSAEQATVSQMKAAGLNVSTG